MWGDTERSAAHRPCSASDGGDSDSRSAAAAVRLHELGDARLTGGFISIAIHLVQGMDVHVVNEAADAVAVSQEP